MLASAQTYPRRASHNLLGCLRDCRQPYRHDAGAGFLFAAGSRRRALLLLSGAFQACASRAATSTRFLLRAITGASNTPHSPRWMPSAPCAQDKGSIRHRAAGPRLARLSHPPTPRVRHGSLAFVLDVLKWITLQLSQLMSFSLSFSERRLRRRRAVVLRTEPAL